MASSDKIARLFLWGITSGLGIAALFAGDAHADLKDAERMKKPGPKKEERIRKAIAAARRAVQVTGVPLSVMLAIWDTESDFVPGAINREAERYGYAWGLGQILATTALDLSKRFPKTGALLWPKYNPLLPESLLDPETNAGFSAFHISQSLKKFAGDIYKAVAAYHQGNATIERLVRNFGANWEAHLKPNGADYIKKFRTKWPHYRPYDELQTLVS